MVLRMWGLPGQSMNMAKVSFCYKIFSLAVLSLNSFAIATEFLRRGGWFVTKVFRSRDYEPLKWVLSQFFRTVRAIKPEASRLESAEIFLVGQNYIAPARIDPKFLDARHVFGEVDAPKDRAALVSTFLKESRKKSKDSIEESTLPKRGTDEDEEDLEVETQVQRLLDEEEKLKKK
uniref:Pre-rRNA processing protein FTSJ3 n=1 Tax=Schistosoma haematobium TaxID=6185 RepID=A0A095A3V9_SCHHA